MHVLVSRSARRLCLAACAGALLILPAAQAKPTTAQLRVEAGGEALSAGVSYVTDSTRIPTDTSPACGGSGDRTDVGAPTALGILNDAQPANKDLRPLAVSDKFSFGLLVCGIGDFVADDDSFWLYKVNHRAPDIGADQYKLTRGDRVLWYFQDAASNQNTGDELAVFAPARATPGDSVQTTVYAYDANGKRRRAAGVTVATKDDSATTDAKGRATLAIEGEGRVFIRTFRTGDISAAPHEVCVNQDLRKCPVRFGDRIIGTKRADAIRGTKGADVVFAQSGDDTVNVRGGGPDKVRCGKGEDRVRLDRRDSAHRDCERVSRG